MSVFSSIASSVKGAFDHAFARPTTIACTKCALELPVPPTAFDWKCTASHDNGPEDEKCKTCALPPPEDRPEPSVRCLGCDTVTTVPQSNVTKGVVEAGRAAKRQFTVLKSRPAEFHCRICNSKLMVPTGPWVCQSCSQLNEEEVKSCGKCQHSFDDQKVICGVCSQSTKVPSMKVMDNLYSSSRRLSLTMAKTWLDISGKPHIKCPRCEATIDLSTVHPAEGQKTGSSPHDKDMKETPPPSSSSSAQQGAQEGVHEGAAVDGGSSSSISGSSSGSIAPGGPGQIIDSTPDRSGQQLHQINCPTCHLQLSYQFPEKVPTPPTPPTPPASAPSSAPSSAPPPSSASASAPAPAPAPSSSAPPPPVAPQKDQVQDQGQYHRPDQDQDRDRDRDRERERDGGDGDHPSGHVRTPTPFPTEADIPSAIPVPIPPPQPHQQTRTISQRPHTPPTTPTTPVPAPTSSSASSASSSSSNSAISSASSSAFAASGPGPSAFSASGPGQSSGSSSTAF